MVSGFIQHILSSFCAHSPFPLSLLHVSPKSKDIFKAVIAQALLCEYMVTVIQSLHEELGVSPLLFCALIQGRFGYLGLAAGYGMIFFLLRILLFGCVLSSSLLH